MTNGLFALALLLPLQSTADDGATSSDATTEQAAPEGAAPAATDAPDSETDTDTDAPRDDEPAADKPGDVEDGEAPSTPAGTGAPSDPEADTDAKRGAVALEPLPASAPASQPDITATQTEPAATQPASQPASDHPTWTGGEEQPGLEGAKWWGLGIGLAASTKNLGPSFKLRYLWVMQTQVGTDYLLTSALNGLSLDDLDAFRFTFNTTVGFRLRPWPFSLDWRHAAAPPGPWPDLVFGLGGWSVLELDHVLQIFRQGDAGIWAGASIGGFLTLAFRDVTVSLLFRPVGITAYYLHGELDSTPFALGNPILDVNLSWTLPL